MCPGPFATSQPATLLDWNRTDQFRATMSFPSGLRRRFDRVEVGCLIAGREDRRLRFWRSRPIVGVGVRVGGRVTELYLSFSRDFSGLRL